MPDTKALKAVAWTLRMLADGLDHMADRADAARPKRVKASSAATAS